MSYARKPFHARRAHHLRRRRSRVCEHTRAKPSKCCSQCVFACVCVLELLSISNARACMRVLRCVVLSASHHSSPPLQDVLCYIVRMFCTLYVVSPGAACRTRGDARSRFCRDVCVCVCVAISPRVHCCRVGRAVLCCVRNRPVLACATPTPARATMCSPGDVPLCGSAQHMPAPHPLIAGVTAQTTCDTAHRELRRLRERRRCCSRFVVSFHDGCGEQVCPPPRHSPTELGVSWGGVRVARYLVTDLVCAW